jgi:hypothetical protein
MADRRALVTASVLQLAAGLTGQVVVGLLGSAAMAVLGARR